MKNIHKNLIDKVWRHSERDDIHRDVLIFFRCYIFIIIFLAGTRDTRILASRTISAWLSLLSK